MKATKSIVVFLFVLVTAQIASAYYCPATGRWLSRDPIGEPGFQTLQMASVVQPVASPAQLPPSRWIRRDQITERGGQNLYRFVGNNPISSIDVLGLACPCGVKKFDLVDSGWTLTGGALYFKFDIRATFLNDKAHDPKSCAYRQFVQTKKMSINGVDLQYWDGGLPADGKLHQDANPSCIACLGVPF